MALEKYRRKRDFEKTPEPPPKPVAKTKTAQLPRFYIQRHDATRLHYDLRLEIGGVLVSWAVPKGPTLDPEVVRSAIRVGDHALDHYDFEGVIGTGDVIVWDAGTWTAPEDPAAALVAGELHLDVQG